MPISRIDKLVRELVGARSLQIASRRRSAGVEIVVEGEATASRALMAHTAVQLALRCFTGPVTLVTSEPEGALAAQLVAVADGYRAGRLVLRSRRSGNEYALGIGSPIQNGAWAHAAGWNAGINQYAWGPPSATAPAAVFATCCAFAKVFLASLTGLSTYLSEAWSFSLLSLMAGAEASPAPSAQLDLGEVGLIGAGAIGSGFAYTLAMSDWTCRLEIADFDHYDEPNEETTMLLSPDQALRGGAKAMILKRLVERAGLDVRATEAKITNGHPFLRIPRDALVCAVDNPESRRILDRLPTGVLLNGAVGAATAEAGHVLFSRHGGEEDPPLSSLYRSSTPGPSRGRSPPPDEITDECSRIAYDGVAMAAPFVGLAAGALLVAGCAHRALGVVSDTRYLKLDLLRLQARFRGTS